MFYSSIENCEISFRCGARDASSVEDDTMKIYIIPWHFKSRLRELLAGTCDWISWHGSRSMRRPRATDGTDRNNFNEDDLRRQEAPLPVEKSIQVQFSFFFIPFVLSPRTRLPRTSVFRVFDEFRRFFIAIKIPGRFNVRTTVNMIQTSRRIYAKLRRCSSNGNLLWKNKTSET